MWRSDLLLAGGAVANAAKVRCLLILRSDRVRLPEYAGKTKHRQAAGLRTLPTAHRWQQPERTKRQRKEGIVVSSWINYFCSSPFRAVLCGAHGRSRPHLALIQLGRASSVRSSRRAPYPLVLGRRSVMVSQTGREISIINDMYIGLINSIFAFGNVPPTAIGLAWRDAPESTELGWRTGLIHFALNRIFNSLMHWFVCLISCSIACVCVSVTLTYETCRLVLWFGTRVCMFVCMSMEKWRLFMCHLGSAFVEQSICNTVSIFKIFY